MNSRVDKIIQELTMYKKAEGVNNFFNLEDTIIHELHIELDGLYDIIDKKEIESDIKEFELYLTTVTDQHKKELLREVIAYTEKKI
ncbi:MAG TPA: hypothetical protein DCR90_03810 [Fusobacteriaceae bacterium]|nr:hypothetical protein [Fusobacteriaceae bacterium]